MPGVSKHAWGQVYHYHIPANLPHTTSLTCLPSYSAHQSGLPPQPSCGDPNKQGSGLLLSHLMFTLFLIFLRNMIIEDLTPYAPQPGLCLLARFSNAFNGERDKNEPLHIADNN